MTNYLFDKFKLNAEQLHDTVSQLSYTIHEFGIKDDNIIYRFFDTLSEYKWHIVGKLKFFLDMYYELSKMLSINEPAIFENYNEFACILCNEYNDVQLDNARDHYQDFMLTTIDTIITDIKLREFTDIDEIIDYIGSIEYLNFQEQQFVLECYYAR